MRYALTDNQWTAILHCPRASAWSVHRTEPQAVDGTVTGWVDYGVYS
jgi:hypothetical protein